MFHSLNFGNPGELAEGERDPRRHIQANWERVLRAIGCDGRCVVEVHQVHGAEVDIVARMPRDRDRAPTPKADAIVTADPAVAIAVRVADCAPVLLSTRDGRIVGAVHAGWRGVVGGVLPAAVSAIMGLGARASDLLAAVGPCIGRESFEVGPEVAAEFERVFGPASPHVRAHAGSPGKHLVDLKSALAEQLRQAGLAEGSIEVLPHCTVAEPELFFSHRRDRGLTGRMAAVIGPLD
jgi:YfiH family protein